MGGRTRVWMRVRVRGGGRALRVLFVDSSVDIHGSFERIGVYCSRSGVMAMAGNGMGGGRQRPIGGRVT